MSCVQNDRATLGGRRRAITLRVDSERETLMHDNADQLGGRSLSVNFFTVARIAQNGSQPLLGRWNIIAFACSIRLDLILADLPNSKIPTQGRSQRNAKHTRRQGEIPKATTEDKEMDTVVLSAGSSLTRTSGAQKRGQTQMRPATWHYYPSV